MRDIPIDRARRGGELRNVICVSITRTYLPLRPFLLPSPRPSFPLFLLLFSAPLSLLRPTRICSLPI